MKNEHHKKFENGVESHVKKIKKADKEKHTVLAYTTYIGTLGLVFILPIIGGAYLGRWLDGLITGYSIRWTLSLMLLGIIVGSLNMYFLVRSKS